MRKSLLIAVIAVVVVAGVVAFLLAYRPTEAVTASVQVTGPRGKTEFQGTEVDKFTFSPSNVTVTAGTRVVWTNVDPSNQHTVTSDGGLFDSGILAPGESFTFTFTAPGTYSYHCSIHPWTVGAIEVTLEG